MHGQQETEAYNVNPGNPLFFIQAMCSEPGNVSLQITSESLLADDEQNIINTNKLVMPQIEAVSTIADDSPVNFMCYPNPSSDNVTIDIQGYSAAEQTALELYNVTGALLKTLQIQSALTQLNIADLAEGVYIIKITTNKAVAVKRLIKE